MRINIFLMKNTFKKLYTIRSQCEVCACKKLMIASRTFGPVLEIASRKSFNQDRYLVSIQIDFKKPDSHEYVDGN